MNKYQKSLHQLKLTNISGGIWIDAGAGHGTYTFPLAELSDLVIAVDVNQNAISYIEKQLHPKISIRVVNFYYDRLHDSKVDGVLFAFSLHYDPDVEKGLRNAMAHLKPKGQIVVIEYDYERSLPWVPQPVSLKRLQNILEGMNLQNEVIFNNRKYYICKFSIY